MQKIGQKIAPKVPPRLEADFSRQIPPFSAIQMLREVAGNCDILREVAAYCGKWRHIAGSGGILREVAAYCGKWREVAGSSRNGRK